MQLIPIKTTTMATAALQLSVVVVALDKQFGWIAF